MELIQEEAVSSIESTKDVVRELLRAYSTARDSDKVLLFHAMRYYGVLDNDMRFHYSVHVKDMPSSETITRCRREIQNTDGELLPTTVDIANRRRIRQEVIRRYYGRIK